MQIITTKDGSHTLFSEQFNEIYHSRHGALQESLHVFVRHGLDDVLQSGLPNNTSPLRIFEVGFGTGLNALLTMLEAEKKNLPIDYETIELYPIAINVIKELNYTQQLGYEFCYGPYHSLHLCRWNEWHPITPYFRFKKNNASLIEFSLPGNSLHLIYFDAFAPEHQPEMWTAEVFRKMYGALVAGGKMVTYCSKSSVQRAMKEAGFTVQKLQGPPGKREMVQAVKK
ncbi:MAG: tRNA (5-methylaminomethyl-2-thiouridine)(34)-methyltransferase MnmD [Chitinophagales bacterium]|nr:tRNA (5-methylaminomethyl-2-thiouridine)(34)-methyltransferase MnmD [Chitinophagales bacterium]